MFKTDFPLSKFYEQITPQPRSSYCVASVIYRCSVMLNITLILCVFSYGKHRARIETRTSHATTEYSQCVRDAMTTVMTSNKLIQNKRSCRPNADMICGRTCAHSPTALSNLNHHRDLWPFQLKIRTRVTSALRSVLVLLSLVFELIARRRRTDGQTRPAVRPIKTDAKKRCVLLLLLMLMTLMLTDVGVAVGE